MKLASTHSKTLPLLMSTLLVASGLALTVPVAQSATANAIQYEPGLLLPSPSSGEYAESLKRRQRTTKEIYSPDQDGTKFDFDKPAAQVGLEVNSFYVGDVAFEGATIIPQSQLDTLASSYKGRQVTLDEVSVLVEQVNQLYRDQGYLTSQAVIPPQDMTTGVLKVQVFEGKLGKLNVEGNQYTRTSKIMNKVTLEEGTLLNFKDLERNLNYVNTSNRFKVKASLSPGANTGETDVTLQVMDPNPWQITATFDNQGRPFVGNLREGISIMNHNLTGNGDRAMVNYNHAAHSDVVLLGYALPVGRYGTEIGVNAGYANVRPEITPGLSVVGTAQDVSLFVQQPVYRSKVHLGNEIVANASFNFREIESFLGDGDPFDDQTGNDQIRSVTLGANFNEFDRYGRTYGRLANTFAAKVFGGNRSFYKLEASATRLFPLPHDNLLVLRFNGQWSPDDLPGAESFPLGGAYSVRGFSEGLLGGDSGYNFSIEHRWPIPFLDRVSPWWHDRTRGVFFFDIGQAFLDGNNIRFTPNTLENTMLAAAGAGLRFNLTQYLSGFVDVGFGLDDRNNLEPKGNPTARLHFGLRSELVNDGSYSARK